ncbi:hypothetical protein H8E07_06860 [bacterium]|nr:hypothetical protein [bacterium]
MKATPGLLLIVAMLHMALAVLMAGCASTPKPGVAPTGEIRVFEVFGMDCPGCHGGLEKLARDVDGVIGAEASWQDKRLSVTIAEGADPSDEAILEAIAQANFTAGERLK